MCGISGIIDFNERVDFSELKNMTDEIAHRGPNDSGYKVIDTNFASIGFGHRRLSILDLSNAGHQPYSFDGLLLVYNGEIYNFKEIRRELQALGYVFSSETDTEVLIKSYHAWGISSVNKFNGMFAFVIYDPRENAIHMVRDRAGIKPLFLYSLKGKILFGSEIKCFFKHHDFNAKISPEGVSQYFSLGYVPNPNSIYQDVQKIIPGSIYTINLKTQSISKNKFWNIVDSYNKPLSLDSYENSLDQFEELITSSCSMRMIADVPIGIFLSGGYDSALITSIVTRKLGLNPKTFTIGFEGELCDESMDADAISRQLGTEHISYMATAKDFRRLLERIPYIWDEPIADTSTIPTLLVSELAVNNVTAALSADGGDEIFGGYDKYPNILKVNQYLNQNLPAKYLIRGLSKAGTLSAISSLDLNLNFKRKLSKLISIGSDSSLSNIFYNSNLIFNKYDLERYTNLKYLGPVNSFLDFDKLNSNVDNLNKILAVDYNTYQSDNILQKIDRATMAVSLEGREPLLDYRIAEFASSLPGYFKIKNGIRKRLVKDLVHKYIPKDIMNKPKRGFGAPIHSWLKAGNKDLIDHYFSLRNLNDSGIYKVNEVRRMAEDFLENKRVDNQKLWSILNYEMWRLAWSK